MKKDNLGLTDEEYLILLHILKKVYTQGYNDGIEALKEEVIKEFSKGTQ